MRLFCTNSSEKVFPREGGGTKKKTKTKAKFQLVFVSAPLLNGSTHTYNLSENVHIVNWTLINVVSNFSRN